MQVISGINDALCIRCGWCVAVCPSQIFSSGDGGAVGLSNLESCINCGHCAAVCGAGAIVHEGFPAEKVHPIDYAQMPAPEQVMLLIRSRRSNRAMTQKSIPEDYLTQIFTAAHAAPTASNTQDVGFTLVTDPARLRQVSDFTMQTFAGLLKLLKHPLLKPILKLVMPGNYRYVPIFERMQRRYEQGEDGVLRKATAVLLIHTSSGSRFGTEDANLAYQNASLMAESLGVGQFYTGFVLNATRQKRGKLEKMLGIQGTIRAGMALGMPRFRYPNYIDRGEIDIQKL